MAALVFRIGRFDETLPTAGITHLVEHLTLASRPTAPYEFNAEVNGRFTTFLMESADPADVADFIDTVCAGLTADRSGLLSREKVVLRTEAASRGGAGMPGTCLNERYGASGPGLAAYTEYGLRQLGWAEIDAWRRRWFVTGNAVLWIAGPVPPGLRIPLPSGSAPAMAPLRTVPAELPGFVVAGQGGIGMSMVGRQSVAATMTRDILRERLTQVLRHEHGLSYAIRLANEQLDQHLLHTWMTADALPEQLSMVAHTMLTTFESVARAGHTHDEAESYLRRLRGTYESPGGPAMVLHSWAQNMLTGRPARQPAEMLQAASEVGQDAVREAAGDLLGQAIVVTPRLIPAIRGRMAQLPLWSAATISGTTYRSRHSGETLTVGDQGAMLTVKAGQQVTVPAGQAAALLRWNDGKRTLIGLDGFAVQMDAADWHDGDVALRQVEAATDPRVMVDLDSPGPGRPARDSDSSQAAQPHRDGAASRRKRAPRPARPPLGWGARIIRGLWFAVVLFGVLAVVGKDLDGLVFAGIGLAGLAGQEIRIRRRLRRD